MRYPTLPLPLLLTVLLASCTAHPASSAYQNATIDALLDGNYDGETTFSELSSHGDFGLGTFNDLDGEMVALRGVFYQITSDGHVTPVPGDTKTPFSAVTFFQPQQALQITAPATYLELQQQLAALRPDSGKAYALCIEGRFASIQVRSVPRQIPPYKRLVDVVPTQSVFEYHDIPGTLVGFWFPDSLEHLNVPGYHFHFISHDKSRGGHVLNLTLSHATAQSQQISLQLALPNHAPTRPTTPRPASELNTVEK